jgi:DNA polymerase-3 subunit beta
MRLRCKKEDLVKTLNKVGNIVSEKTPNLILSYLIMETKGTKVRMVATDMKLGVETFLEVKVEEEGGVAVLAKKFEGIVRELPEGEIAIDTQKNNSVLINSGTSHFRLMGMGTGDFPVIPQIKDEIKIKLDGREFKEIIKHTSFAMSFEERREILNGIYFRIGEGVLRIVGADGRRMSLICRTIDTAKDSSIAVIVPASAIRQIETVVEDGPLTILFSEKQVVFSSGETRFVTSLVAGEFPQYEKIIPAALKYKMSLNREKFLACLKRMALMTSEMTTAVTFEIGKKKLVFSIVNPELGEAREEMEFKGEVEAMTILFNPFYIIDFLKNNDTQNIDFQFNDGLTPCVFKPETQENYLYFLMPIRPYE